MMQRLLDDTFAIEAGALVRAEELVDIAPILSKEVSDRRLLARRSRSPSRPRPRARKCWATPWRCGA